MPKSWADIFAALPQGEAPVRYGIAFTPRSGSTWLGDVLLQSRLLGAPREYFNPEAAAPTLGQSGCAGFPDYYAYLKRSKQVGGVFGVEVNWPRLNAIIEEGYRPLLDDLQAWFYLRREDFVAQAVSLYKAMQSGVFHSHDGKQARAPVTYDGTRIAEAVFTLMNSEYKLNCHFRESGISPRELWYEHIVTMPPKEVVALFLKPLGIEPAPRDRERLEGLQPQLKKIGDGLNEELAIRFRDEHADLVAYWRENRGQELCRKFRRANPRYQRGLRILAGK